MIELLPVESGAKLMVLFGTTKVLLRLNIILDRLRVVFLLILYALSRCYAKKTNNSPLFVLVDKAKSRSAASARGGPAVIAHLVAN